MSHKMFQRFAGSTVALLLLSGAFLLSSCGTSAPIRVTFLTNSPLPAATAGVKYTTSIQADGVTGPPTGVYQYSIVSGTFPGVGVTPSNGTLAFATSNTVGTNDSSMAVITGTPTRAATYTFTVQAQDSLKPPTTGSAQYTLTVNP